MSSFSHTLYILIKENIILINYYNKGVNCMLNIIEKEFLLETMKADALYEAVSHNYKINKIQNQNFYLYAFGAGTGADVCH